MRIKRLASVILAALLVAMSLASCGDKKTGSEHGEGNIPSQVTPADENDTSDSSSTTESEVANTEQVTEEPVETDTTEEAQTEIPEIQFKNKLTGLPVEEQLSNQRPVAIMFNNLKAALPQHGIAEMDVVYEAIVEGSITRLLGIATNWQSLPTLGSIRSSRDYYIDFADAHNAIYVHAGGSDLAYQTIWQRHTNNIDGTNGPYSSTAFYRNQERRKKGVSLEHTLFSSGELLSKAIEASKYSTTLTDGYEAPLKFSDTALNFDGAVANYVYIPFSNYAQSYFDYNSQTGVYDKGQYVSSKSSLDKHDSPHIDGNTNAQLAFENILIIFTKYTTIDSVGRQAISFTGEGTGYYFTDGKCKEIKWERPTRTGGYTLYEADGTTELLLNAGKTYIGVVKNGTEIIYK